MQNIQRYNCRPHPRFPYGVDSNMLAFARYLHDPYETIGLAPCCPCTAHSGDLQKEPSLYDPYDGYVVSRCISCVLGVIARILPSYSRPWGISLL